jgi:hypothetical protein
MSAGTFVIELLRDTVLHILHDRTLHIVGTSGLPPVIHQLFQDHNVVGLCRGSLSFASLVIRPCSLLRWGIMEK